VSSASLSARLRPAVALLFAALVLDYLVQSTPVSGPEGHRETVQLTSAGVAGH
jgi:hypothetical protein